MALATLSSSPQVHAHSVHVRLLNRTDGNYGGHQVGRQSPGLSAQATVESNSSALWTNQATVNVFEFIESAPPVFTEFLYVFDRADWGTFGDSGRPRWNFFALYLRPFLAILFKWVAEGHARDRAFDVLYRHLEALVYDRGSITIKGLFLFRNFATRLNQVLIDDNLLVRYASEHEQARMVRAEYVRSIHPDWGSVTPRSVFERKYPLEQFRPGLTKSILPEGESVFTGLERALRLTRTEFVASGMVEWTSSNPLLPLPDNPQMNYEARLDPIDERGWWNLTQDDVEPLREAWSMAARSIADRRLTVAEKRLTDSVFGSSPEDRLIDEWIALEALYLKSGESSELSYRSSLRIARHLGSTFEERSALKRQMHRSYGLRSTRGVHGSAVAAHRSDRDDGLAEIEQVTAAVLRRAIRQCLIEGAAPNLEAIEDLLLA